tara:strand:- start:406 stop:843 length:438 start_codon:yes stop_codon:yes gene_type:complete
MILSIKKIIDYTYNGDLDKKRNSHKTFRFENPYFYSYQEKIGEIENGKLTLYRKTSKLGTYCSHTTSKHVNWLFNYWKGEKYILGEKPIYENIDLEQEYTCPISLEKIENNGVKTTCGHIFNRKNIDEWLKVHKDCPLCRTILIG